MPRSRFFAAFAMAALLGAAACDGSGEHQVPREGESDGQAGGTLQDSTTRGEAIVTTPPQDSAEVRTPGAPALPDTGMGRPAGGDSAQANTTAPTHATPPGQTPR